MARNYANIYTAIWRDEDFRQRSGNAQRVYLLLATQPDISAAGVLPLTVKRWTSMAADTDRASIVAGLQELQAARFIVYDTDTEELLVRSFIRWDGGYGNPKRRPVIVRAAREVESAAIREALAAEMHRTDLPTDGLTDSLSTPYREGYPDSQRAIEAAAATDLQGDTPETSFSQANSLSASQSVSPPPSDGLVVTTGPYIETATHNPETTTLPPSAGAARAPRKRRRRTAPTPAVDPVIEADAGKVVAAYIDGSVSANLGRPGSPLPQRVGRDAKRLLSEGHAVDRLVEAAFEMGRAGWHDLAVQLQRTAARRNGRQSPADERLAALPELLARFTPQQGGQP